MNKLTIIMPAYNEEHHVFANIERTIKILNTFDFDYKIIIVDDGSKDNTFEEIQKLENISNKVHVMKTDIHKGKGHALKYGFQFVRSDLIMFLDADLDLPPEQINYFLETMKKTNSDIVIGSKRFFKSNYYYPTTRKILAIIYRLMVHILFDLSIVDTQTGIKLFKNDVLKNTLPKVFVNGYAFDLELLVNAHKLGYKIVEIPVILNFQKDSPLKKKKLLDIYKMFTDMLGIFYRIYIRQYLLFILHSVNP